MDENLKIATWEDYGDILSLCTDFFESSPYNNIIQFDEAEVASYIMESLEAPKTEKIIILSKNDKEEITGIVVGFISKVPFSTDRIAGEQVWYVKPEYRNTRTSIRLVEAFEYWADKVAKADIILMASIANSGQEKVDRYYLKKGYTLGEKGFVKGIR